MNQGLRILLLFTGAVPLCYTGIYYVVHDHETWADALARCRSSNGDLYSINYYYDIEDLKNYSLKWKVNSKAWVGLYKDQTWKWSDETNSSFLEWEPGQPDGSPSETCAAYFNGTLYDELCTESLSFFCYQPTRYRKILQLKIQSKQDPNDPAVKAKIMQQIQQKVMEHGFVKNVTIRWKQKDGKVFLKQD